VRIARRRDQGIDRQSEPVRLQGFLQACLRVLQRVRSRQLRQPRADDERHRRRRRIEPGIQKNRAQYGLQRIRQYRCPAKPAGLQLTRPKTQVFAQPEFGRDLRQGLAAHQRRPQARESALVRLRMRLVQQVRHHAIEHRIAQEFQPFIVIRTGAAVSHRGMAQLCLRENVAERTFDPGQECHPICAAESLHLHGLFEVHRQGDIGDVRHRVVVGHVQLQSMVVCRDLDVLLLDCGDVFDGPVPIQGFTDPRQIGIFTFEFTSPPIPWCAPASCS